jgi:hypothetical protein
MITCEWISASKEVRAKYPEITADHERHGADLRECDAWVCQCGNTPTSEGFDAQPCLCGDDQAHECVTAIGGQFDPRWSCARCGRLYDGAGREISQDPLPKPAVAADVVAAAVENVWTALGHLMVGHEYVFAEFPQRWFKVTRRATTIGKLEILEAGHVRRYATAAELARCLSYGVVIERA